MQDREIKNSRREDFWLGVWEMVISAVGICFSVELIRIHILVHTDPQYQSFCALNEKVNCDVVAQSNYAVFASLPVAVWGLLAYVIFGVLAAWGLGRKRLHRTWPAGLFFLMTVFSVVVSAVLWYLSHFEIQALCIVCYGTYVLNLILLFLSICELVRLETGIVKAVIDDVRALFSRSALSGILAACGLAVLALLLVFYPAYWKLPVRQGPGGLATGFTKEGDPWIGATEPDVTIVEFSDYECPHCRRAHSRVRELISANPDRMRLVHRHYPLDMKCHPIIKSRFHDYACVAARAAICAGEQEEFWKMNDRLFQNRENLDEQAIREIASQISIDMEEFNVCLNSAKTKNHLQRDIRDGMKLGIRGTPTYKLGQRTYGGMIPPEVINKALKKSSTKH